MKITASQYEAYRLEGHRPRDVAEIAGISTRRANQYEAFFRGQAPTWVDVAKTKGKTEDIHGGVAHLLLSDIHYGEVVDNSQVRGRNLYDTTIAKRRLNHIAEKSIYLLKHMSRATYDGAIVALNGDMLSGYIHDELRNNSDDSLLSCVYDLGDVLAGIIELFAREFPKVYVPITVGNHGRLDKKPTCKGGVEDNVDWAVGKYLERMLARTQNVTIDLSAAFSKTYKVYNTTYFQTHGDGKGFSGGGGMAGHINPCTRGTIRILSDQAANGEKIDYVVMGHFHSLTWLPRTIVNGSVVGYNEYSMKNFFPYEPPKQALWTTHPDYGIAQRWEVYADEPKSTTTNNLSNEVFK